MMHLLKILIIRFILTFDLTSNEFVSLVSMSSQQIFYIIPKILLTLTRNPMDVDLHPIYL